MDDEPTIRSVPPKATVPGKGARPKVQGDPYQFWKKYYEKNTQETPADLLATVVQILRDRDDQDPQALVKLHGHAEAAIKAYLGVHPKASEPWMYEWLVKAIEARKGPEAEIRQALGYAALLAKRTRNPNDLVRVADMMVMRKIDGTVGEGANRISTGELIDLAGEVVPTNAVPPMMSINLAFRTKDPKRMAESTDRLLALGWPGLDDAMRRDAKKQVDALAKTLRDDGRTDEAEALLARWPETESRDVYMRLTWVGDGDIDLAVAEPLGATAGFTNPRTVFGGALIKNGYGSHPEEVYVCPRAFPGDYTARVEVIFNDPAKPVTEATLEVILHEGAANETRQTHKIKLSAAKPIVVHLDEGRRKVVLPFIPPPDRPVIDPKTKIPDGPLPDEPPARPKPVTPARPAPNPSRP